jgi:hypothetical protein
MAQMKTQLFIFKLFFNYDLGRDSFGLVENSFEQMPKSWKKRCSAEIYVGMEKMLGEA